MDTEQELKDIRRLMDLTYQTGRVGCFEWDLQTKNYILSPGLEKLYGLNEGGFKSLENWAEAIHPEDRPTVEKQMKESLDTHKDLSNEFRVIWPDGSIHWLYSIGQIILDQQGAPQKMYGVNIDITLQKEAEENAKRENRRFLSLIEKSSSGILLLDLKGNVISYGHAVLGYQPQDKVGTNVLDVIHPDDRAAVESGFKFLAQNPGASTTAEYRAMHSDGSWRWVESIATDMTADPNIRSIVVNYHDITQRKESEKIIKEQATLDPLTNTLNRKALKNLLDKTIDDSQNNGEPFTLMFLDLDRFKNINDNLGHEWGDRVLEKVAQFLSEEVAGIGAVGRLGGDEFGIILFKVSEIEEVQRIAKQIMKRFSVPIVVDNYTLFIETSMGITSYPKQGQRASDLLRNADIALYKAKDEGRNSYRFYHDGMKINAAKKIFLEQKMREALIGGKLFLEYQPIIDLESGKMVSMEALMRWHFTDDEVFYPDQFIPLAEETGFIRNLGHWLLDEVIRQFKEWQKQNINPPRVTLNVSSFEFLDIDFARRVHRTLNKSHLDPSLLEFEITETTAMHDVDRTREKLQILTRMGMNIIMDDFGTGYSSLGYLQRFPLQKLKIDKSFIKNCTASEQDGAIVRAIISMAHSLNLQVVAEGIETQSQLDFVKSFGCDFGQGFLLGKPQLATSVKKLFPA